MFQSVTMKTSIFEPLLSQIWKNILSDRFLWLLQRFLCQHLYLSHSWAKYEKNIQSDSFFVTFAAFSLPTSIFEPLLSQIWKTFKVIHFCDFCSVFFANIYIWATLEPNMKNILSDPFFVTFAAFSLPTSIFGPLLNQIWKKHSKWSIFFDFCRVFFANIYIWATLEPNMKKI